MFSQSELFLGLDHGQLWPWKQTIKQNSKSPRPSRAGTQEGSMPQCEHCKNLKTHNIVSCCVVFGLLICCFAKKPKRKQVCTTSQWKFSPKFRPTPAGRSGLAHLFSEMLGKYCLLGGVALNDHKSPVHLLSSVTLIYAHDLWSTRLSIK